MNSDGVHDAGEHALPGWTFYLELDDNGQLDIDEPETVTNRNGDYSFTDIAADTYTVAEVMQGNWEQSYPGGDGTHTARRHPGRHRNAPAHPRSGRFCVWPHFPD